MQLSSDANRKPPPESFNKGRAFAVVICSIICVANTSVALVIVFHAKNRFEAIFHTCLASVFLVTALLFLYRWKRLTHGTR